MLPAIEIHRLGKEYLLTGSQPYIALRDVITGSVKNLFAAKKDNQKFWALKDIDLTVNPGDRVGIIGRNGAGKSTLLKIISRITPPTTGHAIIRGRVGSLLEVGTGFHSELTGRENIYFNGSILGLKKSEIEKEFDSIVEFSGVSKFLDAPLKHYSSGMQLRLAFSVAAHLNPEILLVDEVLAVGDMEFQKKCMGKMEELSKSNGRTIVFVSHDLNAVSRLTDTCLLLDSGRIIEAGPTNAVINTYYRKKEQQKSDYRNEAINQKPQVISASAETSEPGKIQVHNKEIRFRFKISVPQKHDSLSLSFQVMNQQMQPVLHFWTPRPMTEPGIYELECVIPSVNLYMGSYSINTYLGEDKGKEVFEFIQDISPFEVVMTGIDPGHSFGWQEGTSVYREIHEWNIQKLN